jgi:hypothetical protein
MTIEPCPGKCPVCEALCKYTKRPDIAHQVHICPNGHTWPGR